jgi:hypothetical protein
VYFQVDLWKILGRLYSGTGWILRLKLKKIDQITGCQRVKENYAF